MSLEEVGLDPDLGCVLVSLALFRRVLHLASFYALMKDGFEALLHGSQTHLHQRPYISMTVGAAMTVKIQSHLAKYVGFLFI